jgi:glutamyl-tRNA synthetase
MMVRSRFAPSPTGYLHLGSIRTALYAWLHAKRHSGEFVLRIEDTDQERSTQEATQIILDGMQWLGLDYNEGPYYQTQRLDRYRAIAEQLVVEGKAYRCYCSKERINALREQQLANKEKPRYDGHCRNATTATPPPSTNQLQPHVIRFKNPQEGTVTFHDQVNGEITFQNSELDDLIIVRSDGYPTYNFCVVVDDADMGITHVIRGTDHINNTPRQINIFNALNTKHPTYAHVPMILGNDGKLLSKRHGSASVLQYRDEGYLPEAMINYLIRLGWSHGDQEIFSREEMIALFDCKDINKAPAAVNPEKLLWLNRHYIKTLAPQIIAERLMPYMHDLKISVTHEPELTEVVIAQRERCETLREMAVKSRFFYEDVVQYEEQAAKHLSHELLEPLRAAAHRFDVLGAWTKENLHQIVEDIAKQFTMKIGKVAQPLRVAVTGTTVSPPIDITLQLLGKRKVLERLAKAIDFAVNRPQLNQIQI